MPGTWFTLLAAFTWGVSAILYFLSGDWEKAIIRLMFLVFTLQIAILFDLHRKS